MNMSDDFLKNISKTFRETMGTVGKKTDEFVEIQKDRDSWRAESKTITRRSAEKFTAATETGKRLTSSWQKSAGRSCIWRKKSTCAKSR